MIIINNSDYGDTTHILDLKKFYNKNITKRLSFSSCYI